MNWSALAGNVWYSIVRPIAVGGMLVGASFTLFRMRKQLGAGMARAVSDLKKSATATHEAADRTERDLNAKVVFGGIAAMFVCMIALYYYFSGTLPGAIVAAIVMIILGFFFAAVSGNLVGMISTHWRQPYRPEEQVLLMVDLLARRGEERRWRLTRGYLPEPTAAPSAPLALSLPELLAAVDRVLRMVREPDLHDVVPRPLDVDGAMATIRAVLALRAKVRWGDVVAREAAPWEVLSALLALLELARRGELKLRQRRPFSPMEISRETAG